MTIGIYQILNIKNKKRYIGSSLDIEKRLNQHKYDLKLNRHHNSHLQRSWNKDGLENFEFSIILECLSDDLFFYEDLIIRGYKTLDRKYGFNLIEVGKFRTKRSDYKDYPARDFVSERRKSERQKYQGLKFNRILLIKEIDINKHQKPVWLGRCDCGKEIEALLADIKRGHTTSCGCSRIKPERPQSKNKDFKLIYGNLR